MKVTSAALGSFAIAAACAALAMRLELTPTYPGFIVGHITWSAATKFQDLVCIPVFAGFLVLSYRLLRMIGARQRPAGPEFTGHVDEFSDQLVYWSIPFLVALGRVAGRSPLEFSLVAVSALGVTLVAAGCVAQGRRREASFSPALLGTLFLTSLLAAFIPFEAALVAGRLAKFQLAGFGADACLIAAGWIGASGAAALAVVAVLRPAYLRSMARQLLLWSQLGLPLLFVVLYPAQLKPVDANAFGYPTSFALKAFVAALVVWGFVDVLRRCSGKHFSPDAPWIGFSPVALLALAIALKIGNTVTPFISADDYHFGESLLGVWSYVRGAIPYVDYVPAHGLIDDDLPALVSLLLFDGTAATLHESVRLSHALLAIIAFMFIHRYSGSIALAFTSIMFLDGRLAWFFLVPFICVWLAPAWRERPQRWLVQWLVSAPVVFLAVPPQGSLLIAASSLLAIAAIREVATNHNTRRTWAMIGATAAISAGALATPPFASMALGAIRYLLENGPINQVAYGIPWSVSWATPPQPHLLLELIRMSWVVVPVACLWLVTSRPGPGRPAILDRLPALVVFVFVMLLIPYAMGRIDPDRVSTRAGVFAALGWTVLLPAILWPSLRQRHRAVFIATVALFGAMLNFRPVSTDAMAAAVNAEIYAGKVENGPAAGMPQLGMAAVEDKHWARLQRVKSALDEHLAAGETYLDLTNRTAHYFYLDRKPPTPITAPFNMAASKQQAEALKRLVAAPPPLALVEAVSVATDDGRLALRAPLLYRWVTLNYIPVASKGLVLALHRSRAAALENTIIESAIKDITDDNWQAGIHRREAAIVVDNPAFVSAVPVGSPLSLPGGEVRIVARTWREGSAIWFEGPRIDAGPIGAGRAVKVAMSPEETRLSLFEKAFSHADLAGIPIAWGRSAPSLIGQTRLLKKFDDAKAGVTLDLTGATLSGRDAGLLTLEFACTGQKSSPRLRLEWWGDNQAGPTEASTLRFKAENGILIVPVDSTPRWLLLNRLRGIRIALEDAGACATARFSNIELRQRNDVN